MRLGKTGILITKIYPAQHVVSITGGVTMGKNSADTGFRQHVCRCSTDKDILAIQAIEIPQPGTQPTDIPATHPTSQFNTRIDIYRCAPSAQANTPGIKRNTILVQTAETENIKILQKEVALFRKK